jgi:hypothetical protein
VAVANSPSTSSRVLGLAGILCGAVLLAPLLPFGLVGYGALRIILFNVGSIAIVIGVHRRQASAAPALAVLGAIPALLANAWYLAMTMLASDGRQPFAGDFGLVYFFAGLAMWLTDAAFGFVTLRLGVVTRWGALALAVGSLLVITGIDRLGLTSPANPTIFEPIALAGGVLNGIGWIVLGIDIATRGTRAGNAPAKETAESVVTV